MCRRVECSRCRKPTFAGCGRHVEQVLGGVPEKDRCHCNERREAAPAPATAASPTWWKRLLG